MTAAHLPTALQLCRAAGWNQVGKDWRRLMATEPDGCFVAIDRSQAIGTVTTTRYGRELGWIGMMLVDEAYRRRGVATSLMQHSLNYLRSQHVECVKLDATPTGERVYQKLGFQKEWSFHRWMRAPRKNGCETTKNIGSTVALPPSVLQLDATSFGVDRSVYLRHLCEDSVVTVQEDCGFGMLRPGFLASYLGPVCATTPRVAKSIIDELIDRSTNTIYWDIPGPNTHAEQLADKLGFVPVRILTRMTRGSMATTHDVSLQYALADPATG